MFPEIRLVNGRAIIVGSTAAGPRAALVTGAERLVGTLKICSVITETWRVRLGKKGRLVRPRPLAHPPRLHLGLLNLPSSLGASASFFDCSLGCSQVSFGSGQGPRL